MRTSLLWPDKVSAWALDLCGRHDLVSESLGLLNAGGFIYLVAGLRLFAHLELSVGFFGLFGSGPETHGSSKDNRAVWRPAETLTACNAANEDFHYLCKMRKCKEEGSLQENLHVKDL